MWLLSLLVLAHASEPPTFPRHDDALKVRRFARLVGDGPAWGSTPQKRGVVEAWIFRDGIVEHATIERRGVVQEARRYDAGGRLQTTVLYADGAPASVQVHGAGAALLEVAGWTPTQSGPASTLLPPAVRLQVLDATGDPFAPAFTEGLLDGCGCRLEHGTTAWLDGHVGVRLRVTVPHTTAPLTGELWAVPLASQTVVLSALVPATAQGAPQGGLPALAPGRAAAALMQIQEDP